MSYKHLLWVSSAIFPPYLKAVDQSILYRTIEQLGQMFKHAAMNKCSAKIPTIV